MAPTKPKRDTRQESTEKGLRQALALVEEYKGALQRLQAEFENYKKRVEREQQRLLIDARCDTLRPLLGVLDTFDTALRHAGAEQAGLAAVRSQLVSALRQLGVERMEVLGKPFSADLHEAMLLRESEQQPDTIIEEVQAGYRLGERILRHAKVILAKPRDDDTNEGGAA